MRPPMLTTMVQCTLPSGILKSIHLNWLLMRYISSISEQNYDTANPPYIRKYLRTYGLTPPRAESYEVQKTRCMYIGVGVCGGDWLEC